MFHVGGIGCTKLIIDMTIVQTIPYVQILRLKQTISALTTGQFSFQGFHNMMAALHVQ